jgi:hypothetical protein
LSLAIETTLLKEGMPNACNSKALKEIATTLGDSIKNNQDHFDKTIQKVDDAINTETGGTTFCYVDFDKPGPRVGTSSPDNISWVSIHRVGKYPLYSVSIWIIDNEKANYLLRQRTSPLPIEQQLRIGNTALSAGNVGTEYAGIGGYEVVPSDSHDFQVTISSFHSFPWTEWFSMRKIDGEWKRAMMIDVSGTRPQSRGYYRMDEGFPHHIKTAHPTFTGGQFKKARETGSLSYRKFLAFQQKPFAILLRQSELCHYRKSASSLSARDRCVHRLVPQNPRTLDLESRQHQRHVVSAISSDGTRSGILAHSFAAP